MSLYPKTLQYFRELSKIPRRSYEEKKVRKWLISWARDHRWEYEDDKAGNLLIIAPGKRPGKLCLQGHTDMVCVAQDSHDWEVEGVTLVEKEGVLWGNKTTLGADNGIGVAAMMAVAEMKDRPSLELLFTVGEEVGLVGAQQITLPLSAPYGLNLDWCSSDSIGIGCGGTLLIVARYKAKKIPKKHSLVRIRVSALEGGHSGTHIHDNRGNAIMELAHIISKREDIRGIVDIKGGDADNAIPQSARGIVSFHGDILEFEAWLKKYETKIQKKYNNPDIHISLKVVEDEYGHAYEKTIMKYIGDLGSGTQKSLADGSPLSSWNVGKIRFKEGKMKWCYFLRTNIVGGIKPMKNKIVKKLGLMPQKGSHTIKLEMSHESPVWYENPRTNFVRSILKSIQGKKKDDDIPAVVIHATVEAGTLAQKYPKTQWVSLGATCHDMHTTREHIALADLKEFCERLEKVIGSIDT